MTNFRAEDMVKIAHAKGSKGATKEAPPAPEPVAEEQPQVEEEQVEEEVPEGTTAEILGWVGDDQDRAQAALDKEEEDDSPRKGLTSELSKILGNDE